jgi:hypothetical protein
MISQVQYVTTIKILRLHKYANSAYNFDKCGYNIIRLKSSKLIKLLKLLKLVFTTIIKITRTFNERSFTLSSLHPT